MSEYIEVTSVTPGGCGVGFNCTLPVLGLDVNVKMRFEASGDQPNELRLLRLVRKCK